MSDSRCELLFSNEGIDNISIRDEMHNILKPYGRWGLLRRIQREASGQLILCPQCRKIGTQDKSLYHICDQCLGIGYLWQEEWVKYYQWPGSGPARSRGGFKRQTEVGVIETNLAVIYLEAHVKPIVFDKIMSVEFDDKGNPIQPYIRTLMYDTRSVDEYRLDNGRLEYFRLICMKVSVGYYGQPLETFEPGQGRSP